MLNRLLDALDRPFEALRNPLLLAARLLIVPFFVKAGFDELFTYSDTAKFMASHGVPALLLPLVLLLDIVGGLFVAAGFMTRITCLAFAVFTVVANVMFNAGASDETGQLLYLAEYTMVAGFLALMAVGAGDWSVDALRKKAEAR
ncbi:MAG: DoxX family protein [Anaerocolumna sp.]